MELLSIIAVLLVGGCGRSSAPSTPIAPATRALPTQSWTSTPVLTRTSSPPSAQPISSASPTPNQIPEATATLANGIARAVVWSHDGKQLIVAGSDGLRAYDTSSWELHARIDNEGEVLAVDIDRNDDFLATASWNGGLKIWNAGNGALVRQLWQFPVSSVAFSPRGDVILAGDSTGSTMLWQAERERT